MRMNSEELNRRKTICALHGWEYRHYSTGRAYVCRIGGKHANITYERSVGGSPTGSLWRLPGGVVESCTFDEAVRRAVEVGL